MKKLAQYGLVFALALTLAGCGGSDRPPMEKVSGTVTLDDQPIEGASVMFMPVDGGKPAYGVTDAAGRFRLTTYDDGDGALVGDHRVTITKKEVSGVIVTEDGLSGGIAPEGIQEKWIIPERYSNPDASGLEQTVSPKMAPIEFKLTE